MLLQFCMDWMAAHAGIALDGVGLLPVFLIGAVRTVPSAQEPELDDAALVRAVQAGDTAAFRGLVERYQNRVYHVIYGMVRHREDAAELTQDAFVKAFNKLDTFQENSKFYTWLYRIAMNLTIDFVRRRNRAPISSGAEEDVGLRDASRGIASDKRSDSPFHQLERSQMQDAILAAIEALPDTHRQVVVLRELEGLSYKEIADILDLAEGTVMSRLFYARRRLQEALEAYKDFV